MAVTVNFSVHSKTPHGLGKIHLKSSDHKKQMESGISNNFSRKQKHLQKNTGITNIHHRRPRSIGGACSKENESVVPILRHDRWTIITGCMNALQTTQAINCLLKLLNQPYRFYVFSKKSKTGHPMTELITPGKVDCKKDYKKIDAWKYLFAGYKPKQIQREINEIWLDPYYYLKLDFIN